jgi:hypothetical protein
MSKKERNDLRKKELDDLESLLAEFGTTSSAENQKSENQVKRKRRKRRRRQVVMKILAR